MHSATHRARCPYIARTLLTHFFLPYSPKKTGALVVALLAFFPKAKPPGRLARLHRPLPPGLRPAPSVVFPAPPPVAVDRGRSQLPGREWGAWRPRGRWSGGPPGTPPDTSPPTPTPSGTPRRRPAPVSRSLVFILSSSPLHVCRTGLRSLCKLENGSRRDGLACAPPSVILRDRSGRTEKSE